MHVIIRIDDRQEPRGEKIKKEDNRMSRDIIRHQYDPTMETNDSLPICEKNRYNGSQGGGRFRPKYCQPKDGIIIIPYRDRENQLKIFLNNLIPILKRQLVDFTVYVIEQAPSVGFNRGMMRNIGFIEAIKRAYYTCFVFNDVDTILEDDRNLYKCGTTAKDVRHLMNGCSRHNY
ncbi:hypothetical protein KUTeg_015153 [Tegillarca granosa]|uniref:Galactosyltransferase N-terminal domain-containing protein n=1 Tax=Tegillarca granosa TaxID=220873 RepID=A0ABQ9EPB2_TEGGR|nr:hypothetical protein KUTeg_015153 [Tegillarca granosa]